MNCAVVSLALHAASMLVLPAQPHDAGVRLLRITESRFTQVAEPTREKSDEPSMFFSSFGPEDALSLTIELRGPSVPRATHFGQVSFEARTNTGETLSLHENYASGLTDLRTEFATVDREMMFLGQRDVPADVMQLDLKCALPSRAAHTLTDIRGSIKIRTGKPETVRIANARQMMGKAIEHPTLAAAAVQITIVDRGGSQGGYAGSNNSPSQSLTLLVSGETDALLDLDLVDGEGSTLNNSTMWSAMGSSMQYTLMCDRALPSDVALSIHVVTGSRTVSVPFQFSNTKLP
ncbi:MAG: hypothetical protein ACPGXK_03115 [Phycisphaerae bacterium]